MAEANHVSSAWIIRAAVLQFLEEHQAQLELPLRQPQYKGGETL
ncbi:ribbon-helix-helix protein, CopG family [Aquitalea magnusonii]|uniref:Ribbon-helix-helix protein, CopG family n=2 Tax=Aquitalea aquatica TaxID=3044273 RepID=A0A838YB25_9NEIS|nr:ribbon-helix-helix protein, CopG family [Aquitalea magnusonii]